MVLSGQRKRKCAHIRSSRPVSTDVGREETLIENLLFENIIMDGIYNHPIRMELVKNEAVRCKGIRHIRFSNMHTTGLHDPCFRGRESMPLGQIDFYNCSFRIADELDCEKSPHKAMVQRYADALRFINTEFL